MEKAKDLVVNGEVILKAETIERLRELEFEDCDVIDFQEPELEPVNVMNRYSFVVNEYNEVDFDRIASEQQASGCPASLVVVGEHKFVLISNHFLEKFKSYDDITVMGQGLQKSWGRSRLCTHGTCQDIVKARGEQVFNGDDIAEIKREIERAVEYRQILRVNVHGLV